MTSSTTTRRRTARRSDAARSRRARRRADLAAIERLLTASGFPLDGVRDALADVRRRREPATTLVGVAGLEVCCDNALLRSVAVRAGVALARASGARSSTRVISDAEARGIRALYLLTTTAERYFPSFGFRTIARDAVPDDVRETAEFREACPASATVMCERRASASRSCTR